ncbi:MAG TPA: DUF6152 family protein [Gammaproteobacteria bacterium]|nr:DUF6152 family protein [Gammaproteobacteria bacterium]
MNVQRKVVRGTVAAALVAAAATVVAPAFAHHSFAIFDGEQTKVFTGVVTRVNPDANHLQIFFAPMNKDHTNVERDKDNKPITWAVEMAGSAQAAKDGISVSTFPQGTIISVGLHPLRSGEPAGSRVNGGAMFKCPAKTPPAPGKHCDSVAGSEKFGDGALPDATE